ncbi:MAG: thioredoxin [Dehalococcoidales bacterium]|nr:thioredoxin [Dehalococcoidales bacterium]MDD5121914.1 thioredoxin [Dehalococcoidales bacterium]
MVKEITDASFEAEVVKADVPVLVDMWAPWCGPCRMVAPVIDKLSTQYEGKIKFCKMNVDENPNTSSRYQIMSIPTMLLFKQGDVVDTVVGAVPENSLKAKIDKLL